MKELVTEEQRLMLLQQWKTFCFTSSALDVTVTARESYNVAFKALVSLLVYVTI